MWTRVSGGGGWALELHTGVSAINFTGCGI
jgi:hypothetical protein